MKDCGRVAQVRPRLVFPTGADALLGLPICDGGHHHMKAPSDVLAPEALWKLSGMEVLGGQPTLAWCRLDSDESKAFDKILSRKEETPESEIESASPQEAN